MRKLFLLTAMMLTCSLTILAQVTTSSINGKVVTNGEEVIGATITAKHLPSGTVYNAVTNVHGRYTIQGMRVGGPYDVTISYLGLMLPGMVSGWLKDSLGYRHFFVLVMVFCIITFVVTAFVKIDPHFGKKTEMEE